MSTLFYGQFRRPVPTDENVVRATTEAVDPNAPPAEMEGAPEFNEVETDPNPNIGLENRQLASDWHASQQYPPSWASRANPTESFAYVNERIDKVGTAAQREMSGQFGHGTMAFAYGIEPVIREGGQFGADYFAVDPRLIQEAAGSYMMPELGQDHDAVSATAGEAVRDAKNAGASGQYAAWYSALTRT